MHRDVFGTEPVSSEMWVRVMDKTESMYNHARQDTQSSSAVGAIDTEEVVDAVQRKPPRARISTVSLGMEGPYVTDVTRSDTSRSGFRKSGRRSKIGLSTLFPRKIVRLLLFQWVFLDRK